MTTREDVVTFARSLAGLSADGSARKAYLDIVAPGETPERQAEMGAMSGCELTCLAILRRFSSHPLLHRPYVTGKAGEWLVQIGHDEFAASPIQIAHVLPGDIVIVGAGPTEHAWTVLSACADPYTGPGILLDGLDGGQHDAAGAECIVVRSHEIHGLDDVTATYRRPIAWVIDTMAIIERFPR